MENGSRKTAPFAGSSVVLPSGPVQPGYRSGEG
jgi:hypothetical protein